MHEDDDYEDQPRSEADRRFLARLREVGPRFDSSTYFPQLVTSVDVSDPDRRVVLRTLRVDFDGTQIRCGNDPTLQITKAGFSDGDPDLFECSEASDPAQLADVATSWYRDQIRRPIDRYEWSTDDPAVGPYGVLVDESRGLVVGGRTRLSERGEPDRVTRIAPGVS